MKKLMMAALVLGCMSGSAMAQVSGAREGKQIAPLPAKDTCMLREHAFLINTILTPKVEAKVTAKPYRVVKPGQIYTMDYITKRLNIAVNEKRRIVSLKCG